jgi:hypothetical protein
VHPAVIEAYRRGDLALPATEHVDAEVDLAPNERAMLQLLQSYDRAARSRRKRARDAV